MTFISKSCLIKKLPPKGDSFLFIITILFFVFAIGAYVLKDFLYNSSKDSLTIKSSDNLEIILNNNLPLSDKLALQNNKDTVSGDIFKNIQFEVINTHKGSLDFELYLTKEERENEINGKYIKLFLAKANGDIINGFDFNSVPSYDKLNAIDDLPGSRILYRGTIKGNCTERFDFKTWISDRYRNFDKDEEFVYKIGVRVI